MTAPPKTNPDALPQAEAVLRWTGRAMEMLWLLVVVLVPIAYLDRSYAISEAVIAYFEVPKVALLRTLIGLMAILWLVEWGWVQSRSTLPAFSDSIKKFHPREIWTALTGWLRSEPGHWLSLAVWFFLGAVLLGTLFSASISVSLWGETPGQDGYPAYTVVSYVVLFAAISTHLKTRQQLSRLLGAVVLMGFLVGGYAILQHYSHDFLNLTEDTGGGVFRVTSTMGNAIFAAAVLLMTIPATLVAATIALPDPAAVPKRWKLRLGQWTASLLIAVFGASVLAVQLLGITLTLSRGPWIGTLLALVGTLGLAALFVGWNTLGKATVLLAVSAGVTLSIVQLDIPISSIKLWLAAIIALAAAAGAATALGWRLIGQAALVFGLAGTIAAAVLLMPAWFQDGATNGDDDSTRAQSDVERRFSTINTYVNTGVFSGRGDTWVKSWELIKDRPWFEFDSIGYSWLRLVFGYGPDLYRYTYLLVSTPQEGNAPVEPDHAHNFFIHQAVELGILGFISSLGVFGAALLVGGYRLLRQRSLFSPAYVLVVAGLSAIVAGRFVEMMVGVARISDLTILWVLLAILAARPMIESRPSASQEPAPIRRISRSRTRSSPVSSALGFKITGTIFLRLALVAWLIGGIGILTWVKNVNYVRASVAVGEAVEHYRAGTFQASLTSLDKAIDLAPDIAPYYNYRAQVYFTYRLFDEVAPEAECSTHKTLSYGACLNLRAFESNFEGAKQSPFYYRSRWALANSALNLKQDAIAIRLYDEVLSMVPNSNPMRYEIGTTYLQLAQAYMEADRPEAALKPLEATLAMDGDQGLFAQAHFATGIAYEQLDRLSEAAESIENGIRLGFPEEQELQAHEALARVYWKLGEYKLAEEQIGFVYPRR